MNNPTYRGYLYGLLAYSLWGFLPIYWKLLQAVSPLEILAHRLIWSFVILLIALAIRKEWSWLMEARRSPRMLLLAFIAAALLSLNWYAYLWAVQTGYIVKASLGYFINPLVSVLLGGIFLGERLRGGQKIAVVFAAAGVLYLTISHGAPPWIALTLAISFGLYGLLKKLIDLNGLQGFFLETVLLLAPALLILLYTERQGGGALANGDWARLGLLIGAGIATVATIVSFGAAARLIPLSSLGVMQYLAPSTQFLLGVFLYKEPFTAAQLVGYSFIWAALLLYALEGTLYARKTPRIGYVG